MCVPGLVRGGLTFVICAACVLVPRAAAGAARLVVVLHSNDTSSHWTHDIGEGLYGGLRDAGVDLDMREEYLDARRDTRPESRHACAMCWPSSTTGSGPTSSSSQTTPR